MIRWRPPFRFCSSVEAEWISALALCVTPSPRLFVSARMAVKMRDTDFVKVGLAAFRLLDGALPT
jgi:hypothetical protein